MAAVSGVACVRPLRRLLSHLNGSGRQTGCHRWVSVSIPSCGAQQPKELSGGPGGEARVASPWRLFGAVCLQRLPVTAQKPSAIEEQFAHLTRQMDLENSLFSDHELRLQEEAERMRRKKDDYDSDEEDSAGQDIITAEDLEDSWEQRFKTFQPSLVFKETSELNLGSAQRCLADSLLLLARQRVGDQDLWLLPQTQWQAGETLRHTAERALASLPGSGFKATFLGNVPCGVYKYKFPENVRTESCIGAKVFFFKALLSTHSDLPPQDSFMWLRKDELQSYLRPAYLEKVNRFVLNF
ncbi:39S ribosomal protein L46, mitochondrial [Brienomyrus brachyistius]|uniref:39S ribosomal protein L46, mitochondrial n=1 Tax=Brienomyrus brachyistius TaxID=42636 RepID=UPI0020B18529|nr:39S ribosomal protein L46, mitochondrial [Brienomyrus brachyistius]